MSLTYLTQCQTYQNLQKEKEIKEEEGVLADLKLKATNALEKLENKDMALAILYRYISFMTYDEIMSAMYVSRSSLYRLLNEAEEVMKSLDVQMSRLCQSR